MHTSLDYCSIRFFVDFLDLYQEDLVADLDALHDALMERVTDCVEVCVDHQCWLALEPSTDLHYINLHYTSVRARREIRETLRELKEREGAR